MLIYIFLEARLFANSGGPDKTLQNAVSDLGLHCLPVTLLDSSLKWVKSILFAYTFICSPYESILAAVPKKKKKKKKKSETSF